MKAEKALFFVELEFKFVFKAEELFNSGEFGPRVFYECVAVDEMNSRQAEDLNKGLQLGEVGRLLDHA